MGTDLHFWERQQDEVRLVLLNRLAHALRVAIANGCCADAPSELRKALEELTTFDKR